MGCCISDEGGKNSKPEQYYHDEDFFFDLHVSRLVVDWSKLSFEKQLSYGIRIGDLEKVKAVIEATSISQVRQMLHEPRGDDDDYRRTIMETCVHNKSLPILKYFYEIGIMDFERRRSLTLLQLAIDIDCVEIVKWFCCHFWKTITFAEFSDIWIESDDPISFLQIRRNFFSADLIFRR